MKENPSERTRKYHQNHREESIREISEKILNLSNDEGFQKGCRYAAHEARTKYADFLKDTYENGFYFNEAVEAIIEIRRSDKLLRIVGIEPNNKKEYFDSIEHIDIFTEHFSQGYSITMNTIYARISSIQSARFALSVAHKPAKKKMTIEDVF